MALSYTYSWDARSFRHALFLLLLIATALSLSFVDSADPAAFADAGPIEKVSNSHTVRSDLEWAVIARQSEAEICKRWAQQSAVVNGTLYLYGGQASTSPTQTQNTWNNNFLSLDLTQTWQISSPSLSSLPAPSDLPAIALGTLWSSFTSLFLYGGEFSSTPTVSPEPFALWEYNIPSSTWSSQAAPTATDGAPVQRAAEGAGASAAGIGRGWYFGGHEDVLTTDGWSYLVPRIYIKSLLEFTFPGSSSPSSNNAPAPETGAFRNITSGGTESSAGFPERADGVLVFVPGIGSEGILLGLAGGTASTLTQLNVIDVFDISSSTWYKQSTAGPTPPIRVNPCAVAAVAPDGSSVNVYMYGGQDLGSTQTQLSDIWILSLPSFRWIPINTDGQAVPTARAGHTCNIWDGQLVSVGGYVGQELSCDSPGVYVFNLTSLSWVENFTPLSDHDSNPQAKQQAQVNDPNALPGSYGYGVPDTVQHAVGGNSEGGATVTVPVAVASQGPLASGGPKTYTVPGVTTTATAAAQNKNNDSGGLGTSGIIAIVVGIVGAFLLGIAIYMAVCAYLYRKRMRLYQWNMETARNALTENRMSVENSNQGVTPPGAKDYFGSAAGSSPYSDVTGASGAAAAGATEDEKRMRRSSEDLLRGAEPTFVGIMLHPRRSLRVVNRTDEKTESRIDIE